jgi:hypothetical protein
MESLSRRLSERTARVMHIFIFYPFINQYELSINVTRVILA